ncbi:hypothetical protein AB4480_06665 [Vibrio sp. 10N.261.45.A4]|uniref:hypothetical protein n=1 Tax=Vibrio sp. 10N.261.45.A4 TaxID=3229655 RepID=UPI00354F6482
MIVPNTIIAGRYEVLDHIGAGGMQDVYLAEDKFLGGQVALKTPQPGQKLVVSKLVRLLQAR